MLLEEGYDGSVALIASDSLWRVAPVIHRADVQAWARQQETDDLEVSLVRGNVDRSLLFRVGSIRVDETVRT